MRITCHIRTRYLYWLAIMACSFFAVVVMTGTIEASQAKPRPTVLQSAGLGDISPDTLTYTPTATRTPTGGSCPSPVFSTTNYPTDPGPYAVAVADLNNDSKSDLITPNDLGGSVSVLLGNGMGTFSLTINYPAELNPRGVAIGDLDHDGNLDVVTANYQGNNISVLLGTGSGSLGFPTTFPAGNSPRALALGDFNHDTNLDVVVADGADDAVSVLLGVGTGSFGGPNTIPSRPQSILSRFRGFQPRWEP